jgi:hypothetical protein
MISIQFWINGKFILISKAKSYAERFRLLAKIILFVYIDMSFERLKNENLSADFCVMVDKFQRIKCISLSILLHFKIKTFKRNINLKTNYKRLGHRATENILCIYKKNTKRIFFRLSELWNIFSRNMIKCQYFHEPERRVNICGILSCWVKIYTMFHEKRNKYLFT